MRRLKKEFFSKNFVHFLLVGGLAALVNFSSRIAFNRVVHSYAIAIVLAYLVGVITAFFLNKHFTFSQHEVEHSDWKQFYYFCIINVLGITQTLLVSLLLARIVLPALGVTWAVEEIAHFIGLSVPVVTSYLGHKYITFKKAVPVDELG